MKRVLICIIAAAFFSAAIFAQNIELPGVTTIVTGETEKADKDALPGFSNALKVTSGSGGIDPELPPVENSEKEIVVPLVQQKPEKTFSVEGLIGGGYPLFFIGDVSLFRSDGDSPYKISFTHDQAFAYVNHSITDNFSDRTTKLELEKSYKKNNLSLSAGGRFKSSSDGLQGLIKSNNQLISFINRDSFSAEASIAYEFSNGFITGLSADGLFYNRYAEQACNGLPKISYAELSPELFVKWQGHGFEAGLTADYSFSTELSDDLIFKDGHRAEFKAMLQWQNDFVRLYGMASAVIGNSIKEKQVIVPFTAGLEASVPLSFSERRFLIFAEGGIKSYKSGINELEDKYKFTQINWNPAETSDWYGKIGFTLPISNSFTGTAFAEYRKTAYDNGILQPKYNDEVNMIYSYSDAVHELLITDFKITYVFEGFSISGSWHSNWLEVPALESRQYVGLAFKYQDSKERWGAEISGNLNINNDFDIPFLNVQGFVKVNSAARIILSVNDIIKLYKAETRSYAGKFVARGGSAALLVKFNF